MRNNRQRQNVRPYVDIPAGQPPIQSSPDIYSPYSFEITPAAEDNLYNPWDIDGSPETPRPSLSNIGRPYRTASVFENGGGLIAFPVPDVSRSASQRSSLYPRHRSSKSDVGSSFTRFHRDPSAVSLASSYNPEDSGESTNDDLSLSRELSNLSLDSEEGLRRFQAGDLSDNDAQWHLLVPPAAREALGKREVERQSVMFEVFLAERNYVSDLELVKEVFIEPLKHASPPIIPEDRLAGFISEVFWNFQEILAHHQRMLGALFERQREQHPLVQSVADIILDASFLFQDEYESYIKHYPLAEACHRKELKRNAEYQVFLQECSQNPRVHKSDIINFLLRPATRLPRLNLVLDRILKLTDPEHPDLETLPLIMSILYQLMKSAQPGIASAESKVKFWELCENLVYQKGEIIDMDLHDESRTVVHMGPLARRQRSEMDWRGWVDLHVALLDNFLIMTREETRPSGVIKRHVVSRPIPLEYLRLGSFTDAPDSRKEHSDDRRLLDSLRFRYVSLYPFTIYHASSKSNRRYTLYSTSESGRQKWYDSLVNAIGVHKVRQEANTWFQLRTLSDKFFRVAEGRVAYNSGVHFTGRITCATLFSSGGKNFIAVGCATGIYVVTRGATDFHKVLGYSNPTSIAVLQDSNKFIVHFETSLLSYSLDLLARVAQGQSPLQSLDASMEKIAGQDGSVLFVRTGRVGNRTMVILASKGFMQTTLQALEAVHISDAHTSPRRAGGGPLSFRSFGGPMYVPKDAYDISPLVKTVAVSTDKGILIVDPTNLGKSVVTLVPDWSAVGSNLPMANLKARCDGAKPIGLVRCDAKELLVIYDVMGCYITKHGVPSRSSGFLRWETKATSYAYCGHLVLLFSSEFIEIRNVNTGRLVQVIEGSDIALLHCGLREGTDRSILVSMRDRQSDMDGVEKIVELLETSDLSTGATLGGDTLWDEWDMDA